MNWRASTSNKILRVVMPRLELMYSSQPDQIQTYHHKMVLKNLEVNISTVAIAHESATDKQYMPN
jgi:hypothetical protein